MTSIGAFQVSQFSSGAEPDELDCPEPEDRLFVMRDWSCNEYNWFKQLSKAYLINCYTAKSIQVLCFTILFFKLAIQRCR